MAKYEPQPDPFGDRSTEACASYTAMQADYSSASLLAAAVNEVRPRRLDVVLAAPAVRAAFADMWPALAAPAAYVKKMVEQLMIERAKEEVGS